MYRLSAEDLLQAIEHWNLQLKRQVLVVACGGTALTLLGHKESTKDVDFLVPRQRELKELVRALRSLGYSEHTSTKFLHPRGTWLFELNPGQTIFQTELLDPVDRPGQHSVAKQIGKVTVAVLNSYDLIISKMFRGDQVDVEDSITLLQHETLDITALAKRYKETADYYFDPAKVKQNLGYLIIDMKREQMEVGPLEEVIATWNP